MIGLNDNTDLQPGTQLFQQCNATDWSNDRPANQKIGACKSDVISENPLSLKLFQEFKWMRFSNRFLQNS